MHEGSGNLLCLQFVWHFSAHSSCVLCIGVCVWSWVLVCLCCGFCVFGASALELFLWLQHGVWIRFGSWNRSQLQSSRVGYRRAGTGVRCRRVVMGFRDRGLGLSPSLSPVPGLSFVRPAQRGALAVTLRRAGDNDLWQRDTRQRTQKVGK